MNHSNRWDEKEKTFFFADYEQKNLYHVCALDPLVPTQAEREGNLNGLIYLLGSGREPDSFHGASLSEHHPRFGPQAAMPAIARIPR